MKLLRLILATSCGSVLWAGCTTRTIEYGGVRYHSIRFAMEESFGGLSVTLTNGVVIHLEGYKSDGSQAVSAATEGAVTAILKSRP